MKSFVIVILCLSLAICHAVPVDNTAKVTLDSADAAASGDANIGHRRLVRYGGFGYPGYGGYGGYPGGYGGYPGGGGFGRGYGGGYSSAQAFASASAGGFGGGYGGGPGGFYG